MKPAKISSRFLMTVARGMYLMGTVMVVTALVLSTGIVPASASPGGADSQQERIFCNFDAYPQGEIVKVEDQQSPWTFTLSGPGYISVVGIKAATECAQIFTSDGSSECYRVSGIGTNSVTVWDLEDAPPSCREISHLEILIVDPVPTETIAPTGTPTETPDVTGTPTNTPEPTNTPTSTPEGTPTETPEEPTSTPTDTPEPTETPTNTPEPTDTPEPTETPTNTPDPTSTPEDPTETPEEPTETPQDPTSTPEDPTQTPEEPTSTPQPSFTPTTIPTNTPVPTVDQPEGSGTELLIPVTGVEMPLSSADGRTRQRFWGRTSANTGMLLFGLGMIFHGAALWKKRKGQPREEDRGSR